MGVDWSWRLPQVLLKWNVQRGVPVIPKASSLDHMRSNIEGLFEWRLSYEQKVRRLELSVLG